MDFAPDALETTSGAILGAGNIYPTLKGWRHYPSLVPIATGALPKKCLGAFTAVLPGGNVVVVAGTEDQLYLYSAGAWVSQALSPSTISGRWRFDQYGSLIIGVNGSNAPFSYNGSGAFGALAGSPPNAALVQASDYSLFLVEPNSAKWWSSLSATVWTPSIATQTVTDTLDETPGNIIGLHRLRGGMTLYKNKSFAYSQFQGPPFYWDFNTISTTIGAPCHEAIANLGEIHYWPGNDDFYSFDAYSLNRVPNQLRNWFFDNLDSRHRNKIASRWDQKLGLIFWHFPSRQASPAGALDSWICLNTKNGKWGASRDSSYGPALIDMPFFNAIETGALTYDALTTTYPTYGAFSGLFYGDLASRSDEITGALPTSGRLLSLYNGVPAPAMIVTNDLGDYVNLFECSRVKPHFSIAPATKNATLTVLNQREPGTPPVVGLTKAMSNDGFFNFVNTARMQRFKIVINEDAEAVGFTADTVFAGDN